MKELRLFAETEALKKVYTDAASSHNDKTLTDTPDSGFDLYIPHNTIVTGVTERVNYHVKCAMVDESLFLGYYLYARSSIYKSPLRLANSVGVIDSGYRGSLMAVFDVKQGDEGFIELQEGERYVQLCSGTLEPFRVRVVETLEELGAPTARGEGGFGSTGI
jgi:dUTP pyrophosphatase